MANYAVTDYRTLIGDLSAVLAALETQLETIDATKTIRYIDIKNVGSSFVGVMIYDA